MKYFISQPMKSVATEEEILKTRENIITKIKAEDPNAEIFDSYFTDYNPTTGNVGLKFLAKSLMLLADADVLVCAKGWEKTRGCRLEHACAEEYGIKISFNHKSYGITDYGHKSSY